MRKPETKGQFLLEFSCFYKLNPLKAVRICTKQKFWGDNTLIRLVWTRESRIWGQKQPQNVRKVDIRALNKHFKDFSLFFAFQTISKKNWTVFSATDA